MSIRLNAKCAVARLSQSPLAIAIALVCSFAAADASAQCSIQFTSPARGSTVTTPTIGVSGTASGFAQQAALGSASATVNGSTFFSYSGVFTSEMNFGGGGSAVATLQPGANRLTVSGSVSGCSDSDSMVIYYAPPPPVEQKSAGRPRDENCSNPVNGATGNKYQIETDYVGAAGNPLSFERHYNSSFVQPRALGRGWRHSYDRQFAATGTSHGATAFVVRPDGMAYRFTKGATGWTADADVTSRLVDAQVGGQTQWQLTIGEDNSTEIYNANGRLTSIVYANARRVDFSYDENGRLQFVTDVLSGRRLTFAYAAADSAQIATMTDPAGNVFTYNYAGATDAQRLASVVYPGQNAPTRQYLYNESTHTGGANLPDALTGIVDENGDRYATFGYDSTGRGVFTEHAGGVDRYDVAYNSDGSTTVTDALGAARTYTYTSVQGVLRQVGQSQPAGAGCPASASARTYDANGNVATSTDFNGNVTTLTWDTARNLLIKRVEGVPGTLARRTTNTEWHGFWRLPARVNEPDRRTTYVYNGDVVNGNPVTCAPASATIPAGAATRPAPLLCKEIQQTVSDQYGEIGFSAPTVREPRVWSYTYGASGQVLTVDGPRTDVNDVTTYAYSANGDLKTVTNALGHVTHLDAFDDNGRPLSLRDVNGVVITSSWHPRGWLVSSSVDGLTTAYGRDAVGQLLSRTLPDGSEMTYQYDAAQRLTGQSDMTGRALNFTLDNVGNALQAVWSNPGGGVAGRTESSFDVLGREQSSIETRNGVGYPTQYGYDANGNRRLITDPKVQTTQTLFDALNRGYQTTDPISGVTQTIYLPSNHLRQITSPNGSQANFSIDGLGLVLIETLPDRQSRSATYDTAGNQLTLSGSGGFLQTRSYDALNRVTSVNYPNSGENIQYVWDGAQGCSYGVGRLCAVTDVAGSTTYAYDARGNLVSKTRTEAGHTYTTSFGRDAADRLSSVSAPTGQVVSIGRDADGVVEQLTADAEGQPQLKLVDQVEVDAAGNTVSLLLGNGATITRTHAEDGRLLEQLGSPPLANLTLGYDANGNLISRTLAGANATFGYDALDRVVSEAGPAVNQSFTYDGNDNRLSDASGVKTYRSNSDRLLTVNGQSVTYDPSGNQLQARGLNLTWNQAGQLASVSQGSTLLATYFYDERGLRSRKVTTAAAPQGARTVVYHYDEQAQLIAETAADGAPLRTYVWRDGSPQAVIEHDGANKRVLYLEVDHVGSPVAARSQGGQVVWKWDADAFGNAQPNHDPDGDGTAVTINLRYPGQYFDVESGLHYNWNRYYDPSLGRYVSSDPIGFAGGTNTFSYANQNPQRFTDMEGLCPVCLVAWGVFELASSAYDIYNAGKTVMDPCVRPGAKAAAVGGAILGVVAPGGGYGTVGSAAAKGGAASAKQAADLSKHLGYAEKYGKGGVKELENGRIRYYGEVQPARNPGEMAGARYVHEYDAATGRSRGWLETVDQAGNVRQVRPELNNGSKTHYQFDRNGSYTGSW